MTRDASKERPDCAAETPSGRVASGAAPRRYTLDELLDGVTPQAMRAAFDWGDDVGREASREDGKLR